jgi:hypothetical protein
LALLTNVRLDRKNIPLTNTLAYFVAASVTKKKKFFNLGGSFFYSPFLNRKRKKKNGDMTVDLMTLSLMERRR